MPALIAGLDAFACAILPSQPRKPTSLVRASIVE